MLRGRAAAGILWLSRIPPLIYAFVAASAVVPSLLLMLYFHRRDVYPEPAGMLWKVFAAGVATVLPVVLVAGQLAPAVERLGEPLAYGLAAAFLLAAIPEELFKFLVVWALAARRREFDEPMDGVVYGVVASLGFATLENVLYVIDGGAGVAVVRALTAVPSHAFLGAIMGYYLGRARFAAGGARGRWLAKALLVPIVLHGLYDFPLLAAQRAQALGGMPGPLGVALISLAPLIVVGEWILAVRLTRGLRLAQIRARPAGQPRLSTWPNAPASYALAIGGALAASVGGMVLLGGGLALAIGELEPAAVGEWLPAGVLLGLTPLAMGAAVFVWGIVRLNERG